MENGAIVVALVRQSGNVVTRARCMLVVQFDAEGTNGRLELNVRPGRVRVFHDVDLLCTLPLLCIGNSKKVRPGMGSNSECTG